MMKRDKIPQGYKQTEIGIIPQDWEVVALGNALKIRHGKSQKLVQDDNGEYPIIATGGRIGTANQFLYNKPSVLIGRKGTIDEPQFIDIPFWSIDTLYYSEINLEYNPRFLYYKALCVDWYKYNEASGVPSLSASTIEKIELSLPKEIKEQQAIAEVLSDIDELISVLEQKIAKKRAIKEGAMRQLLTAQTRLEGFSEPWGKVKFLDIIVIHRGQMITSNDYIDGNIPVIAGGKTPAGFHAYSNRDKNTITISASGANAGFVNFHINSIFATDCSTISETHNYDIKFIYYLLSINQDIIYKAQTGGAQPHIHPKDVYLIDVLYTRNKSEQQAIAKILTDMDDELEGLERKKEKYIVLKQAAMQKLLTGEIRLKQKVDLQIAKQPTREANVHFKRSVWAAQIANHLYEESTFGHVKMEKLLFLTENMCGIDLGSNYHRDAAGPYDNRAIRSIDSQLKKQKWFEAKRTDKAIRYIPLEKRGGHKEYFDKYFSNHVSEFDRIINTLRSWNTERCEIIATLYSAWKDFIDSEKQYTDDDIINEVLNNWHNSKQRISKERWQLALNWMRENRFTPKNK